VLTTTNTSLKKQTNENTNAYKVNTITTGENKPRKIIKTSLNGRGHGV
jgi:hypothetical protein